MPGKSGFTEGCEGGAVAGGSVDGSGPSSRRVSVVVEGTVGGAEEMGGGSDFAGAPRSWGVYSVVSCGGGAVEM